MGAPFSSPQKRRYGKQDLRDRLGTSDGILYRVAAILAEHLEQGPGSPPEALLAAAPDPLHAGMAFIGDVLETAHRIGELRHCRRLRKAEQQRAGRESAGMKGG